MSHRKFWRQQRKLASIAAQMPKFQEGRWVTPRPPAPAKERTSEGVLIAVRAIAPRAGRGAWNR